MVQPLGWSSFFVRQRPPLHRHGLGRVLPQAEACFDQILPRTRLVPSSWFPTTSTVCATLGSSACCSGLPTMGFAGFPRRAARVPTSCPKRPHRRITLQSLPLLQQRAMHHCTSLPPRPSRHMSVGPRGVHPLRSPLLADAVSDASRPMLSWASRFDHRVPCALPEEDDGRVEQTSRLGDLMPRRRADAMPHGLVPVHLEADSGGLSPRRGDPRGTCATSRAATSA
jgi:hypothetical protein